MPPLNPLPRPDNPEALGRHFSRAPSVSMRHFSGLKLHPPGALQTPPSPGRAGGQQPGDGGGVRPRGKPWPRPAARTSTTCWGSRVGRARKRQALEGRWARGWVAVCRQRGRSARMHLLQLPLPNADRPPLARNAGAARLQDACHARTPRQGRRPRSVCGSLARVRGAGRRAQGVATLGGGGGCMCGQGCSPGCFARRAGWGCRPARGRMGAHLTAISPTLPIALPLLARQRALYDATGAVSRGVDDEFLDAFGGGGWGL